MFGDKTLKYLLDKYDFKTVLDIGSGKGEHSNIFRNHNKIVTEIDNGKSYYSNLRKDSNYISGNYLDTNFNQGFDCIWACHVLEHQLNVNLFLKKINNDLKEGGVLAITVPPAKPYIVGGHLTWWNEGLLMYNLILANFDCSKLVILKYDYNISIILKKRYIDLPTLAYDYGDVELLKDFFPKNINLKDKINNNLTLEGFNGDIK